MSDRKVPCAGGCGRMETCEPYHDPEQVYCMGCGIAAGREEARRRRARRTDTAAAELDLFRSG